MKENSTYRFDVTISSAVEDGSRLPAVAEESLEGPLSDELLDRMQRFSRASSTHTG